MTSEKPLDVLVVGAGPVGLFCANELIRHGLSCRIVDKKTGLSDKSKALGLHIRTLDMLKDAGFIDAVLSQGHQVGGALFKSHGKALMDLSFANLKANVHFLIDLPQDKTERILCAGLQDKNIEVEWQTELTEVIQNEQTVAATLKKADGSHELVECSWVIACDGAHSTVRDVTNMAFSGTEYKQNWWLADLLIDWDLPDDRMIIYLSEFGPLACFPMGEKRYRLVMTAPESNAENPTLADIEAAFNVRSSDAATLSDALWVTKFYIHHRQVEHYRRGRIFFAGDAAHIHSPMGGQGLNTGLQDIYNLVWKLALVQKKLAPAKLLDSYHRERFPVGKDILKKTDTMTRMMIIKNPLVINMRNTIVSLLMSVGFIRDKVASELAELNISYAKSPIVKDEGWIKNMKAGTFLTDFYLLPENSTGPLKPLHEIVQGTKHHLFLFMGLNQRDTALLEEVVRCVQAHYANMVMVHVVLSEEQFNFSSSAAHIWVDKELEVHRFYRLDKPAAILLRPDKYVGLTQKPIHQVSLIDYLHNIFVK